eukprot:41172-Eustigmatos_ZCMA.PRE.1
MSARYGRLSLDGLLAALPQTHSIMLRLTVSSAPVTTAFEKSPQAPGENTTYMRTSRPLYVPL